MRRAGWWAGPEFGRDRDLRHTVQVALRQVCAWSGIRPAPTTGESGPHLGARPIWPRTGLRAGDTPERGGRWTTTGKQRRINRRDAGPARDRPGPIGALGGTRSGYGPQVGVR